MGKKQEKKRAAALVVGNGLIVSDHGLQGLVFETTALHAMAVKRHERVAAFIDICVDGPPGGMLLIMLAVNELVLNLDSLKAAVSPTAQIYASGDRKYLEWEIGEGWIDRRELSRQTVAVIEEIGACMATAADWRWAAGVMREIHPERPAQEALPGLMADAQAWWVYRSSGPIFAHAIRQRPFQLLNRAALARRDSRMPQLSSAPPDDGITEELALVQTTRIYTKITATFDSLIVYAGQVARAKGSKDHGRAQIDDWIKMALPLAAREGRVQVIALGATRHAIANGGVRGGLWAVITIYEYLRQGLRELVIVLFEIDIDGLDGWGWLEIYEGVLKDIRASQRMKFSAFLEVFHRFLVIAGFDPLPRSLSGGELPPPPAAAVVWPHELQRAVEHVTVHAPSPRIRLQATLGLVFGFWVPLRTIELWCVRVRDVHLHDDFYVVIYPRRRDGVGKTPSVRRQEEIHAIELKALLIDMVRMRQQDDASDDDVLLGQPGKPDERHEELATAALMNAALRWATGDSTASFYDLRHSVFSRRVEAVLLADSSPSDAAEYRQVAAQGGHAGPTSTEAYIHQIEGVVAAISRASRPNSW